MRWNPVPSEVASAEVDHSCDPSSFSIGSMVQRTGLSGASSFGAKGKEFKTRRRPYKTRRKPKVSDNIDVAAIIELKQGAEVGSGRKENQRK
ncbi:unnamed protein product [Arabis nemorensis]|uniref:Uncharacterized protein n=1 Tax=Arabis nemorensis TaxID=586526 RepID=A0A565CP29_9BRAS|nr:unnamed protein product [Arabis nemorensis]